MKDFKFNNWGRLGVLLILLTLAQCAFGQSATKNADGTWNVELTIDSGKDMTYTALKLVVSKGIKAKKPSTVTFGKNQVKIMYNKSTKEYTIFEQGVEGISTTTVSAIRDAAMAFLYKAETGKTI